MTQQVRLTQPLGGKPQGSIIDVIDSVADSLINQGKATPVVRPSK